MEGLQQQPKPPDTAKEEALKQYVNNLQQAKDILNLLTIKSGTVDDETLSLTFATLKTLLIDAGPYIKKQDEEEYGLLLEPLLTDPMNTLRNKAAIDSFQNTLNRVLKNSGLYELGKPSQIKRIMQHIDIDEEN